jgi:hypothetical protein
LEGTPSILPAFLFLGRRFTLTGWLLFFQSRFLEYNFFFCRSILLVCMKLALLLGCVRFAW